MIPTLRKYFLSGLVALAPVGVTLWVLYKLFVTLDIMVSPHITRWVGFQIPGLGLLAVILFVLLTGLFASNIVGRTLISRAEQLLAKVPLFSRIYLGTKQIGEAVLADKANLFERVVAFEYPRRECWALGFVTSEHRGELASATGRRLVHVFVPTTPNPTSGFLLFIPESDTVALSMTVEEGLKLVVSGGAVAPPWDGASPQVESPSS
ncbi:MAG: DUF502 domain-containing protein [Gemmatimonadota bacterium]|jgi:uncharacterized membrane protein|nr:DUF502 domain-containing protein [Gemmatimonadota bacterium]